LWEDAECTLTVQEGCIPHPLRRSAKVCEPKATSVEALPGHADKIHGEPLAEATEEEAEDKPNKQLNMCFISKKEPFFIRYALSTVLGNVNFHSFLFHLKPCRYKHRMQKSKSVLNKYLRLYNAKGILVSTRKFRHKIIKAISQAEKSYKELKKPRTNSINVYIDIWVRKVVIKDLASRNMQTASIDNPPSFIKSLIEYLSLFPSAFRKKLNKKLYNTQPKKRKKVWESFNLPFGKIEKTFKRMVMGKTKFAQKKGYDTYIDVFLDKYQISKTSYKSFIKNVDQIIKYCNQQFPKTKNLPNWFYSWINSPCFICEVNPFPFRNQKQVLGLIIKEYKILEKFKNKLIIKPGEGSSMSYKKETDHFEITINKHINNRHQIMDLIHEISHVVVYLNSFNKEINPLEKGSYWREKKALEIEMKILKKLSPLLYRALFGEFLTVFRRTLFEIQLYSNPHQNLNKLYAQTFNQCFKKAKQKNNPLYILDEYITSHPFSTLSHAVAQVEVLKKFS